MNNEATLLALGLELVKIKEQFSLSNFQVCRLLLTFINLYMIKVTNEQ